MSKSLSVLTMAVALHSCILLGHDNGIDAFHVGNNVRGSVASRQSSRPMLPQANRRSSALRVSMFGDESSSSPSSSSSSPGPTDETIRRLEFMDLEPIDTPEVRKQRLRRDDQAREEFCPFGNELWQMRREMKALSEELMEAISEDDSVSVHHIRKRLRELEDSDPEVVYKVEMENFQAASQAEQVDDAKMHYDRAMAARNCLPHFNLDGLWVGKYGNHGYELINITYVGDTMMAFKVTGDASVPRGEISFQANLSPFQPRMINVNGELPEDDELDPIILTENAAKKWGTNELPRHKGLGQVAEKGFQNNQWMEGQLIIIGEQYFSFAWVPIEHQIFFGRPSPELVLKMLREGGASSVKDKTWEEPPSMDDDVNILKDYVASCLEKTTETIEEDLLGDTFSCIWHGAETEECYFE